MKKLNTDITAVQAHDMTLSTKNVPLSTGVKGGGDDDDDDDDRRARRNRRNSLKKKKD